MDPTSANGSKSRRQKSSDPFYAPPKDRDTAAEIINEARSSLKMVNTKRPFTPKDSKRSLFGDLPGPTFSRPPSSFSLNSKHFDPTDSRPPSGTKLTPIEHKPVPPTAPLTPLSSQRRRSKDFNERKVKTVLRANSAENSSFDVDAIKIVNKREVSVERRSDSAPKERSPRQFQPIQVDSGYLTSESRGNSGGSEAAAMKARYSRPQSLTTIPNDSYKKVVESSTEGDSASSDVWAKEVEPLVGMLKKDGCPSELLSLVTKLDDVLHTHEFYRQRNTQRSVLLKSVFKLLDIEDAQLQMKLSEIILKYRVSGNNLNNVCKLVFKLSKVEENDVLFAESTLLDLLLDVIVATEEQSVDVLVYVFGALKFLTSNTELLEKLVTIGLIPTIANYLSAVPDTPTGDKSFNILVQVTACLRNIVEDSQNGAILVRYKIFGYLLKILNLYLSQGEVTLNICRILSRVVTNCECCKAITTSGENWCLILKSVLKKHYQKASVCVRVLYFLSIAAVTSENQEQIRSLIYSELYSTVLMVLGHYIEPEKKSDEKPHSPNVNDSSENEDVLIKSLSLMANLSLTDDVGLSLSKDTTFIGLIIQVLTTKPVLEHRELVLNTIVLYHNLSYFAFSLPGSALSKSEADVTLLLVSAMMPTDLQSFDDNLQVMTECVRVYANLSRSDKVRQCLSDNQIDLILFALVECGRRELLFNVIGVLVNLSADVSECAKMYESGLLPKLISNLSEFGFDDWQLSSAVCKTIWNYLACCAYNKPLADNESTDLVEILTQLIESAENVREAAALEMTTGEGDVMEMNQPHLEEFLSVAGNLLKKIENSAAQVAN